MPLNSNCKIFVKRQTQTISLWSMLKVFLEWEFKTKKATIATFVW
jgi:hypothetical protein